MKTLALVSTQFVRRLSVELFAIAVVWLCMSCLLAGCREKRPNVPQEESTVSSSALRFEDVKSAWDGEIVYRNGEEAGLLAILESLGGGAGVLDFDRDGYPDFCAPGGGILTDNQVRGLPSRLMALREARFQDVSQAARIDAPQRYSHGCSVGDFNNDGFSDMLITGYGGVTLWENSGDGTFADVTGLAGLTDTAWSSSAGWGDLNGDGSLDLYVAHYVNWSPENNPPCSGPSGQGDVCPPRQFDGLDDIIYFSRGDGSFTNGTQEAGLVAGGKGLGVLLADFDSDHDLDIYVANDTTSNFLYLNKGHGEFEERGTISGTALDDQANANGSMGLAVSDFDNDGRADIWVSNYEDEVLALYQNQGGDNFTHVSSSRGIRALGQLFVGFGCVANDFDNDGDDDFAVANGHVVHVPRNAPGRQQPLLLENLPDHSFRRIEPGAKYFSDSWSGRGLSTLDFDDDGRLDLLFVNSQQPAALVRNASEPLGHVLRVRLVGTTVNRNAIGARVRLVTTEQSSEYAKWVYGGGSYLSSSEDIIQFGIPTDCHVQGIEVTWPGGFTTAWRPCNFSCDFNDSRIHVIVEPAQESFNNAEPVDRFQSLPLRTRT